MLAPANQDNLEAGTAHPLSARSAGKEIYRPGRGTDDRRRMPVGSLFRRAVRFPLRAERTTERLRTYLRHANRHGRYDASKENSDPETSPLERSYQIEPVSIGDKTWIGDNVCILPGTRIGRGSVVGANSVVRGVFPDYCVIVGAPARIVKRYDPVRKGWYGTDPRGEFVS